ncbi:MAG TPA: NAD(P)/FAD-dependent oxidoreductase [Ktedonobacterales bacterium]|nr:NAD(P)/FAD-dependent oxidoreductase [Ktedonobacterales bacterium]
MRTAILGGGALGLTLALRLAQRGDAVVVMEKEPLPGGLAAGFPIDNVHLEKFYHHLFRSDTTMIALINELGLGERLEWHAPKTSSMVDGKAYAFSPLDILLHFSPLPLVDRVRLGAVGAYLKLRRGYAAFEQVTAAEWMARWMGKRAYELVWQPILESKFGNYYPQISMAWMWSRLHCRSFSLGYLRGGFQQVYDALVREISACGGEVRLGCEVLSASMQGQEATASGAWHVSSKPGPDAAPQDEAYDRVISTLPTRLTFRLIPELPEDFRERYDWGLAYGAHCLIVALKQSLSDVYWLQFTDRGYPFLAAVEHTNLMPTADYGGRHLLYLGNYLPMTDPLFKQSKEEVLLRYLPHLKRINPLFSPDWVTDSWMFAAPFAQPIVTRDFPAHIPPHETPLPNLWLANMFQVYPQDRGQNYSVAMAERLVKRIAG